MSEDGHMDVWKILRVCTFMIIPLQYTTVLSEIVKLFVLLQNADVVDPDFLVERSPEPLPTHYGIVLCNSTLSLLI